MGFIEHIKMLTAFTDAHEKDHLWSHIIFDDGEVYAQGPQGGLLYRLPESHGITLAVPAKPLLKALQAVGDDVKISRTKDHKLALKGPQGKAHVEGLELKELPVFPRPSGTLQWIEVKGLHQASRFAWCASTDATRPHLGGFHFHPDGYLEVTDGHSLVRQQIESSSPLIDTIVPTVFLANAPETSYIALDAKRCYLSNRPDASGGYRVANEIRGTYPVIEPVLVTPRAVDAIGVDREALIAVLRRIKLSYHEVILIRPAVGNQLQVSVSTHKAERLFDFEASIDFRDINGSPGPSGKIMLNAKYLENLLASAPGPEAILHIAFDDAGGLDPVMLVAPGFNGVLMPMRFYG
jgi:DNA polymerase III sliding clamp (beta) subunit (PCNA family)